MLRRKLGKKELLSDFLWRGIGESPADGSVPCLNLQLEEVLHLFPNQHCISLDMAVEGC